MNITELVAILRDRSEGLARMALNNHDSSERNRLLGKCEAYNDCTEAMSMEPIALYVLDEQINMLKFNVTMSRTTLGDVFQFFNAYSSAVIHIQNLRAVAFVA